MCTWEILRASLSISCKTDLLAINSLDFVYLKIFLFFLYFLKDRKIFWFFLYFLIDRLFFQHFEYIITTAFLHPRFLIRNQLLILLRILCTWWVILSCCFKSLFVLQLFDDNVTVWISLILFYLVFVKLLGCVNLWFLSNLECFWYYFLYIFFWSFLFYSLILIMHMLMQLMEFFMFLRLFIFSSFFFFSVLETS